MQKNIFNNVMAFLHRPKHWWQNCSTNQIFLGRKIRRITLWFDKFLDAIMVEYDIKLGIKSTKHGTGSKNSKSRTIYISSNDHVRQVNGKEWV